MAPSPTARAAARHLAAADPLLGKFIQRVGVRDIDQSPGGFPALARSIIFQQISGAAGTSILRRTREMARTRGFPSPAWFLQTPLADLRGAGLSPQKIGYLRDLAQRVAGGEIHFPRLRHLPDEEVIGELTRIHGVGRWTAQMYLLFHLGRPDVLPTGDLGVRKGVQRIYGYRSLPAERTVERHGAKWRPYCSWGSYYMWRSQELLPP